MIFRLMLIGSLLSVVGCSSTNFSDAARMPETQMPVVNTVVTTNVVNTKVNTKVNSVVNTKVNTLGMTFVSIPAGTFLQGALPDDPDFDVDEVQRKVNISRSFYMQTTEVTQKQWLALMAENPSAFAACGDDCPVERVSYALVQSYLTKLNAIEAGVSYRLPTEAEWEYAARAGSRTAFNTGECLDASQANVNGLSARKGCDVFARSVGPVAVASYPPNPWGLYDMHGNVWELCEDWYGPYESGETAVEIVDPQGPETGKYRVLRGGSWRFYPSFSRSANRLKAFKDIGGFRLIREEEPLK